MPWSGRFLVASWCSDHQLDPVNCPVGTVLEFLQDRFTARLTPSTLKVYVAAISAYHIPLGGMSMGNDPPGISCTWNFHLAWLKHFFILDQVTFLKSLLMWRGRLCCKPSFLPLFKMRTRKGTICFFCFFCLDAYVHRAALWRKNEQLFICFGPPNQGSPASKQRMSKWVIEAISLAYESAGQPSPMAVRSHSTRSMDASKVRISMLDIRSYSPRGLWCGRLLLTAHIRQILFFGPGLYPRFPSALVLVLLVRFTQDRHSSLWWCCTSFPEA